IHISSVNPGIEANDGTVTFQLVGGELLRLGGGTWPFLGGTLTLRPIEMRFGNAETRRYILELEGVNAAKFIERMELSNLAVTGTFDGTLPLVFDEQGNGRIEGGVLLSRPPGGNISYVGQLTYEDMGAIPNFAFSALKSLDYKQMFLQMDGSLTGEIVTRVRFDGVSQGAGAKQNFLTKQVAKLPFRFDVNVRAPFYALISSIRAMYDPSFILDPREIGLIDADGRPVSPAATPDPNSIQPSESEKRR
ncbi:MAG: YdbH domain-containing protein, partial [Croceibacterium sp.]